MIKHISEEEFNSEVISSNIPVLVDFSAGWCGPCRTIAPVVDKMAEEFDNRVKIVKIDIDESPQLAQQYEIRGVPTFVFLKNGKEMERVVGVSLNESQFREKLETFAF